MIAWKTFRELWILALIYMIVLWAVQIPTIHLWPALREVIEKTSFMDFVANQVEFMKRWKDGISDRDASVAFRNFMAIQLFFRGINIFGVAAAVLLGTGLIARERENQTLEFLVSRPVSRSRILWSKFWVAAVMVVVPIFLVSWSAIPLAAEIEEDLKLAPLMLGAFHSSVFVLMFLALTMLFSVWFHSQVHTAAAVGTVVVIQVSIYFTQQIRVTSLFRLSDFEVYSPIMLGNTNLKTLFMDMTGWMMLAIVVLYIAADRLFQRRTL